MCIRDRSSDAGLLNAVGAIKAEVPDAFVLVSFAVLPDGYTREGMYLSLIHIFNYIKF